MQNLLALLTLHQLGPPFRREADYCGRWHLKLNRSIWKKEEEQNYNNKGVTKEMVVLVKARIAH